MIRRTTSTRTGRSRRNNVRSRRPSFFRGPQRVSCARLTAANKPDQEGPIDLLDEDRVLPGCVGDDCIRPDRRKAELAWNLAAGLYVVRLVLRHLTPNGGGRHAYRPNGLRMRPQRSRDGLRRRFAPCCTVTDQLGSDEIDGYGQFDSGPVGLASWRLAGSFMGMDPGTRRLRLRTL